MYPVCLGENLIVIKYSTWKHTPTLRARVLSEIKANVHSPMLGSETSTMN